MKFLLALALLVSNQSFAKMGADRFYGDSTESAAKACENAKSIASTPKCGDKKTRLLSVGDCAGHTQTEPSKTEPNGVFSCYASATWDCEE